MYENKIGVLVPNVMLPPKGTDFSKWAVVACDQYTSQPEYWAALADLKENGRILTAEVGQNPGIVPWIF